MTEAANRAGPSWQQTVQGASATDSGLLLLPMLLAMLLVSLIDSR